MFHKHLFVYPWGLFPDPGATNIESRDGLLHLLVVGNIWGVISSLFSDLFSDFSMFRFSVYLLFICSCTLDLGFKQPLGNGTDAVAKSAQAQPL